MFDDARVFAGGGRFPFLPFAEGCRFLMIYNISMNERVIILLSLTSTSSIRIASRRCLRNSCASCWRKSKYWSYFWPRDAKMSLASSDKRYFFFTGPKLTWGLNNSSYVPFAMSKNAARSPQIYLQWRTPQSKCVHRVLLDHDRLSIQVIDGMPLRLMRITERQEGYPEIGRDEINIALRLAAGYITSATYPWWNRTG